MASLADQLQAVARSTTSAAVLGRHRQSSAGPAPDLRTLSALADSALISLSSIDSQLVPRTRPDLRALFTSSDLADDDSLGPEESKIIIQALTEILPKLSIHLPTAHGRTLLSFLLARHASHLTSNPKLVTALLRSLLPYGDSALFSTFLSQLEPAILPPWLRPTRVSSQPLSPTVMLRTLTTQPDGALDLLDSLVLSLPIHRASLALQTLLLTSWLAQKSPRGSVTEPAIRRTLTFLNQRLRQIEMPEGYTDVSIDDLHLSAGMIVLAAAPLLSTTTNHQSRLTKLLLSLLHAINFPTSQPSKRETLWKCFLLAGAKSASAESMPAAIVQAVQALPAELVCQTTLALHAFHAVPLQGSFARLVAALPEMFQPLFVSTVDLPDLFVADLASCAFTQQNVPLLNLLHARYPDHISRYLLDIQDTETQLAASRFLQQSLSASSIGDASSALAGTPLWLALHSPEAGLRLSGALQLLDQPASDALSQQLLDYLCLEADSAILQSVYTSARISVHVHPSRLTQVLRLDEKAADIQAVHVRYIMAHAPDAGGRDVWDWVLPRSVKTGAPAEWPGLTIDVREGLYAGKAEQPIVNRIARE